MGLHLDQIEGLVVTADEVNVLSGITVTTEQLNQLSNLTVDASDLNEITQLETDLTAHLAESLLTAHPLASIHGSLLEDATVTQAKLSFDVLDSTDLATINSSISTLNTELDTLDTQVDNLYSIVAPEIAGDVGDVLQEMLDHMSDTADAHDALAVSFLPTLEISTDIDALNDYIEFDNSNGLSFFRVADQITIGDNATPDVTKTVMGLDYDLNRVELDSPVGFDYLVANDLVITNLTLGSVQANLDYLFNKSVFAEAISAEDFVNGDQTPVSPSTSYIFQTADYSDTSVRQYVLIPQDGISLNLLAQDVLNLLVENDSNTLWTKLLYPVINGTELTVSPGFAIRSDNSLPISAYVGVEPTTFPGETIHLGTEANAQALTILDDEWVSILALINEDHELEIIFGTPAATDNDALLEANKAVRPDTSNLPVALLVGQWNEGSDLFDNVTIIQDLRTLFGGGGSGGSGTAPIVTVGPAASGADYEVTGVGDDTVLTDAIADTRLANGGTLFLMAGAYSLSTFTFASDKIRYVGASEDDVVISHSGDLSGSGDVHLENMSFTISGEMNVLPVGEVYFKNVTFSGAGTLAIEVASTLYDCTISCASSIEASTKMYNCSVGTTTVVSSLKAVSSTFSTVYLGANSAGIINLSQCTVAGFDNAGAFASEDNILVGCNITSEEVPSYIEGNFKGNIPSTVDTDTGGGEVVPEPADGFRAISYDYLGTPIDNTESAFDGTLTTGTYTKVDGEGIIELKCDKTLLATTTGTSFTLSGAPTGFVLEVGNILYSNNSWKKVETVLGVDSGTLDAAFDIDLVAEACMIAQAAWTKNLITMGDETEKVRLVDLFPNTDVPLIHINYEDSLALNDIVPDFIETARIAVSATNSDQLSTQFTPIFTRPVAPEEILNYPLTEASVAQVEYDLDEALESDLLLRDSSSISQILTLPSGSISSLQLKGVRHPATDGSFDSAFDTNLGTGFSGTVWSQGIQDDGKIVLGGAFGQLNGITKTRMVRLNSDGTEDAAFYTNLGTGFAGGNVISVAIQSDQKILASGTFTTLNGITRNRLVRLNSDGTLDAAFYTNLGTGFAGGGVYFILIQSDNKILLGGAFNALNGNTRNGLVRLNSDGTEDVAFYTNLGTGFDTPLNDVYCLSLQSDNKILVGGDFTTLNGNTRNGLVRLNSDGTEDAAFYTNLGTGFAGGLLYRMACQLDDKIVVVGNFTSLNGNTRNRAVRLNSDGTEDTGFYGNLGTGFSSRPQAVGLQSDGRILICGPFTTFNGNTRNRIVRLHPDGTEDVDFYTAIGTGFASGQIADLAVLDDASVFICGDFSSYNGSTGDGFVKLLPDSPSGSVTISLIADDGSGDPSTDPSDVAEEISVLLSSLTPSATELLDLPFSAFINSGDYHIVVGGDALYQLDSDSFSLLVDAHTVAPGIPVAQVGAGATWDLTSYVVPHLVVIELGQSLYLVFFPNPNNADVIGQANLLNFEASLYAEETLLNGGFLFSSFCWTDSVGTAVNCSNPTVVASKTRVELDESFIVGVNPGDPDGDLEVYLDGLKIPKYFTGVTGAYWKEVTGSTTTIELDSDYSAVHKSVHTVRRQGSIDSSDENTNKLSALYNAIVGSVTQVEDGIATHSTIASAVTDLDADGVLTVLAGTYTENVSLNKRLLVQGQGYGTTIDGTLTVDEDFSLVEKLRTTGLITVNGNSCFIKNIWTTGGTPVIVGITVDHSIIEE